VGQNGKCKAMQCLPTCSESCIARGEILFGLFFLERFGKQAKELCRDGLLNSLPALEELYRQTRGQRHVAVRSCGHAVEGAELKRTCCTQTPRTFLLAQMQ
jgi:hypothetical protein